MRKYRDVPMDYADATLIALAEELDTPNVFTLDLSGFRTNLWKPRARSKFIRPPKHSHPSRSAQRWRNALSTISTQYTRRD